MATEEPPPDMSVTTRPPLAVVTPLSVVAPDTVRLPSTRPLCACMFHQRLRQSGLRVTHTAATTTMTMMMISRTHAIIAPQLRSFWRIAMSWWCISA